MLDPYYATVMGPSEEEPNNNATTAQTLLLDKTVVGWVDAGYGDHDFWVVIPPSSGWIYLAWTADNPWLAIATAPESGEVRRVELPVEFSPLYYNVSAGVPLYLDVLAT